MVDAMECTYPEYLFFTPCTLFTWFDWTGGGMRGRLMKNFGNLCIPFRICVKRKAL